jgi:pyruvate/2-oxoglutarate dehydrogenase complex dihydrolipoamide dehydrogenase (E3) component
VAERTDVVVVGMGPGGEDVAGRLAEAGLSVVGVEQRLLGGECPYWGCVPTKMIVRAANLLAEARRIPGLAGEAEVRPDWAPVAARIRAEATDDWDDRVAVERFEAKGGRFVRGWGRLVGPRRVAAGRLTFEASRAVVLATGTRPAVPPVPGLADLPYWTNREAIAAEVLPADLVVLGAGAVGLELAQAVARFGVAVTVLESAPRPLPTEEPEASEVVAGVLKGEGIELRTSARASWAGRDGDRSVIVLDDGSEVSAERLLVATGRVADLAALGVEHAGLDPSARWLPVDGRMRATPGLWGVGDITGVGAFTHVAAYQAAIAAADILGHHPDPADYRALPRVTFTDPEVGAVGLTEATARDRGLAVRVGTASLPRSARGWIHKAGNEGLVKLVEDAERGVLVGATAVGPSGGEVLGLLTLAVHARVRTHDLASMIYAYPTFHRAVEDALRDLRPVPGR